MLNKIIMAILLATNLRNLDDMLIIATRNNNIILVQELIDAGANVNAQDSFGWTSLHIAVYYDCKDITKLLISRGANVNYINGNTNITALNLAINQCSTDMVKLLLDNGASVYSQDNKGDTPLHMAAFFGHKDVVELLINKGAIINISNRQGYTPIGFAVEENHEEVVRLLLFHKAIFNVRNFIALILADPQAIKPGIINLLLDNINFNDTDACGHTLLDYAVCYNNEDIVKLLLFRCPYINRTNHAGRSLLHHSASNNRKDIVQLLLDYDVDKNIKDEGNKTAADLTDNWEIKEIINNYMQVTKR